MIGDPAAALLPAETTAFTVFEAADASAEEPAELDPELALFTFEAAAEMAPMALTSEGLE